MTENPRKSRYTFLLSDEARFKLEEIALSFGFEHRGRGNVSALIEAIGSNSFVVVPHESVKDSVKALLDDPSIQCLRSLLNTV